MGAIWDSPVDFQGVEKGLPAALSPTNTAVQVRELVWWRKITRRLTGVASTQAVIRSVMQAYLRSAKQTVAKHKEASARFHETSVEVPSLVVYCDQGDPIADTGPCEEVTGKWAAKVGRTAQRGELCMVHRSRGCLGHRVWTYAR